MDDVNISYFYKDEIYSQKLIMLIFMFQYLNIDLLMCSDDPLLSLIHVDSDNIIAN